MSKRREVQRRVEAFGEIRDILAAMKNLALLELQKVGRFATNQRRAVQTIEQAAADFFSFYLNQLSRPRNFFQVSLLIGSERGFCGDFNEQLVAESATWLAQAEGAESPVIVGSRLAMTLERRGTMGIRIQGPEVAEDVETVLAAIVETLGKFQRDRLDDRLLALMALYHDDESDAVRIRRLLPIPELPAAEPAFAYAPYLDLSPIELFRKLADHHLYAALHEVLYSSLLAENRQRLNHMDGAMRRIDDDLAKLKLRYNVLRQEEIIEDIEVILLSEELLRQERA
jgi:F-type H+-transporting ATPase subunit gamma